MFVSPREEGRSMQDREATSGVCGDLRMRQNTPIDSSECCLNLCAARRSITYVYCRRPYGYRRDLGNSRGNVLPGGATKLRVGGSKLTITERRKPATVIPSSPPSSPNGDPHPQGVSKPGISGSHTPLVRSVPKYIQVGKVGNTHGGWVFLPYRLRSSLGD